MNHGIGRNDKIIAADTIPVIWHALPANFMQVELKQDLVGSCVVGDVVTVLGLVKVLATGDSKPSGEVLTGAQECGCSWRHRESCGMCHYHVWPHTGLISGIIAVLDRPAGFR